MCVLLSVVTQIKFVFFSREEKNGEKFVFVLLTLRQEDIKCQVGAQIRKICDGPFTGAVKTF